MNYHLQLYTEMALQSIRYTPGQLEILDQLLLPVHSKYVNVKGVEDGWRVINKMQVSRIEQLAHCIHQKDVLLVTAFSAVWSIWLGKHRVDDCSCDQQNAALIAH